MKIAYILFGNLNKRDAHANFCLSFASNFSKKENLVFFSSYIFRKNLGEILNFFLLEKTFKIIRWSFFVSDKNLFFEVYNDRERKGLALF